VPLAQRSAEHGEILCENIDQPAVDRARSGDDAIAGDLLLSHAEVGAIMLNEHVIFFEATGIEQHAQPLSRSQPSLGMLRIDALLTAAHAGRVAPLLKLFDHGRHDAPYSGGA